MPIENDDELEEVANRVSDDLAQIQEYLGKENNSRGKIKFPRGYIRHASTARAQLWYIRDETVKRNLAYAHLQADVLRWLLNRTDIWGTAQEMIIKEIITLAAAIAETLTKQIATQEKLAGKKRNFNDRCDLLVANKGISESTSEDLKWLWDQRQNVHIFLAEDWEYGHYKMQDCNRAIKALRSLKSEIDKWSQRIFEDIPF